MLPLLALTLMAGSGRADELKFTPSVQPAPEMFTASSADENGKLFVALLNGSFRNLPQEESEHALVFHSIELKLLGHAVEFYQKYPTAPQRWSALSGVRFVSGSVVQRPPFRRRALV